MKLDFSQISYAALSDIGHRRELNEDAVLAIPDMGVFMVCDGLGGAKGGAEASRSVVDCVAAEFEKTTMESARHVHAFRLLMVNRGIGAANQRILKFSGEQGFKGMGSTVTALVFSERAEKRVYFLHAGDSPAFRLRGNQMDRLIKDHSVERALGYHADHLPASIRLALTSAVGLDPKFKLEPTLTDWEPGDVFLLCTDGLTKMLPMMDIGEFLMEGIGHPPEWTAKRLVREANEAGGYDNVSVVLLYVT